MWWVWGKSHVGFLDFFSCRLYCCSGSKKRKKNRKKNKPPQYTDRHCVYLRILACVGIVAYSVILGEILSLCPCTLLLLVYEHTPWKGLYFEHPQKHSVIYLFIDVLVCLTISISYPGQFASSFQSKYCGFSLILITPSFCHTFLHWDIASTLC